MEWQWITYNMMGLCPDIQPLIKVTTEHHLGIICMQKYFTFLILPKIKLRKKNKKLIHPDAEKI